MNRALFLDRDGVLNVDTGYIGVPERLQLIEAVIPVLKKAQRLGYLLVIITNQSGIARGYFSEADYAAVTARLQTMFTAFDIRFAGIYHCPHHQDGIGPLAVPCSCRKPMPGLIRQAAEDLDIDLKLSVMVGDKQTDMDAGAAAGVGTCFLIGVPSASGSAGNLDLFNDLKQFLNAQDVDRQSTDSQSAN